MKKEWFVLQTLTGQENKVQRSVQARIVPEGMSEYVGACIIPTERVTETRDGKKRTLNRKVFPGYVLIEMALYEEGKKDPQTGKREIVDRTWQFLRETPGVIGSWLMQRPTPLSQAEIDAILSTKPAQAAEKPRPKVTFNVNETVKITDGAFMGLTGQVSMVDPDKGKLKVEVSVFNRKVPVDVDYWQVEKMSEEDIATVQE